MTDAFADEERKNLTDRLHQTGPLASTLCDGWQTQDLAAHLWLREHEPLTAIGMFFPPLANRTVRRMVHLIHEVDYDDLVDQIAARAGGIFKNPKINEQANTFEFFIHHEDIRRAGIEQQPRVLPTEYDQWLWNHLPGLAKRRLANKNFGIIFKRLVAGRENGEDYVVSTGPNAVTLSGEAGELALWLYGRGQVAKLGFSGDPEVIEQVKNLNLAV